MVTRHGARPRRQPNNVDFLSLISALHKEIRRPVSITWVEGHQDSDPRQAGSLSRDASNNIAVDKLATQHRLQRKLRPVQAIPHLPILRVCITINGLRIVGHFDSMLRYHINGYHLRQHMQRRFGWEDSVWDRIDHQLFAQHFCSLTPAQQVPRMKFIHDQQPLGVHVARHAIISDNDTNKCPCCHLIPEDQVHLLRCTSNPLLSQAISSFQKSLHSKDLHAVYYLFCFGALHWLADGIVPAPMEWDLRGYPSYMHPTIHAILLEQEQIGWLSGLKGFLSRHWITLASLSMDSSTSTNLYLGRTRLRHLLHSLYAMTTNIWKGRNDALHGAKIQQTLASTRLDNIEIRHYYTQPELLASSDRHYCERPLLLLLQSSPANKRRWLCQVKRARLRRLTDQQFQSTLPQYFARNLAVPTNPTRTFNHAPLPFPAPPPRQTSILSFFRSRTSENNATAAL